MKTLKWNLLIILMITCSITWAQQYVTITDEMMLDKYDKVLKTTYPHLFEKMTVDKVYSIGDKYSMIDYEIEGIQYNELIFEEQGKYMVIANYMEIPQDKVPKIVLDRINEKHKESEIEKYFQVSGLYDLSEYYGVQLANKDGYIYYDRYGRLKDAPK